MKRFFAMLVVVFLLIPGLALGHSGRTDSSGGHNDNRNASGLGGYHYHHGYGPHLHTGGICPYTQSNEVTYNPNNPYSTKVKTFVPYTMTNSNVVSIQKKLKEKGYDPKGTDGVYGAGTTAALKQFQKDNGLTADGICGPATKKALGL